MIEGYGLFMTDHDSSKKPNFVYWGVVLCIGVGILIICSSALRNFITIGFRAKRSEAFMVSEQIRQAQLVYFKEHQKFVAADVTVSTLFKHQQSFDPPAWSGWEKLNVLSEYGDLRCSYEVKVEKGGKDFLVIAQCDLDGDGKRCEVHTSKDQEPKLVSDNSIY